MVRSKLTPEKKRAILASIDWSAIDAMTDSDIRRQIAENPDAAREPSAKVRLVWCMKSPRIATRYKVRLLRRALRMTRAQFGQSYGIPEKTLQGWEQGAREPDQAALSYLAVIAEMPDRVRKALRKSA